MLSLSIYQAYVCFAIGLYVSLLLMNCLEKEVKFSILIKRCFLYLAVILMGLVFYWISLQIMLRWFWPTLSSYQGIDELASGGMGGFIQVIMSGIGKAYTKFFDVPFKMEETLKLRRMLYLIMGIIAVIEMIIMVVKNEVYKNIKIILLLVLMGIYPLAVNSVFLMGSTSVSSLMLYCAVVPTLLVVALTQKCLSYVSSKSVCILCYIASLSIIGLSYHYYLISNECYNRQYFTYEQTYGYMNRVAYAIQSCDGYSTDMPVMLLGNIEKERTMPEFDKLNYVTGIFGESDLINGYSREEFIRRYCGLPIVKATDDMRNAIVETLEYRNMPLWPQNGSVKVIDGCCVVKFAEEE